MSDFLEKSLKQNLHNLYQSGDLTGLIEVLNEMPVVEVALFLADLPIEESLFVLQQFEPKIQAHIFSDLNERLQEDIIDLMTPRDFSKLLSNMLSDDRADVFKKLNVELQNKLLPFLTKQVREDILHLSSYKDGTAGSVMSSDFATITVDMTVEGALDKIRQDAPSKETIYYIYVVDDNMKLMGFISLKDLILAKPEDGIKEMVVEEYSFAHVDDDQETVAKKIETYDLIAIPIVNSRHQILGIVTHDDAIDILRQEQTEDMEKFMGISGAHENYTYLRNSVFQHVKNRSVWLISLAILGILSAFVIHQYEDILDSLVILALYAPMLADAGGNCGSQAATVIIRALAIGEIRMVDWLKVVWKEFRIGFVMSFILGILAFLKVVFLSYGTELPMGLSLTKVALVISLAIALQVVSSTSIGALLPLTAKYFKFDPAVVASPAITTFVDITGFLIYFSVTTYFLF
ncbi:MAG: magnesium transporter [Chitinophagaceae bacterium]|nr:MAG: magnesium transporter [Chitinophagaceae bacterium]